MPQYQINQPTGLPKAVGYIRVSTVRQAKHEMSLEEQKRQIYNWAQQNHYECVEIFCDAGVTGRIENRREFQKMMEYTKDPYNQIRCCVFYNFSRAFRNVRLILQYYEDLEKQGIAMISATQEIPPGPNGKLMLTMIASMDAHASEVNAAQVRDAMQANARAGYWSGSRAPLGYKTVEVANIGGKSKKGICVNEQEAELVRTIFSLYVDGTEVGGPMGMKAIASYLNKIGHTYRGKPFYHASIDRVLKNETYIGIAYYNKRDHKNKRDRERSEWIPVSVQPIIDEKVFYTAARLMAARNRRSTPPRIVNGPTLLAGLLICSKCGGAMMLRTGKSGQYKYYTCANQATGGKALCQGQSVRLDWLDEVVIDAVSNEILNENRIRTILNQLYIDADKRASEINSNINELEGALRGLRSRMSNLLEAIELGVIDLKDASVRDRMRDGQSRINDLEQEVLLKKGKLKATARKISPQEIQKFCSATKERIRHLEPRLRRSWLHLYVDRVELCAEEVRICGPQEAIVEGAASGGESQAHLVPNFARDWRTRQDSNL